MLQKNKGKLVVILGPTAAGKTSLAIQLATQFNGEIINADSRSVYRGMNIGTGKPTVAERKQIPHHLLDIANPDERFTLAQWQKLAVKSVDDILARNKLPFLVGGTGLYISSIIDNYDIPQKKGKSKYDLLILGVTHKREELYNRINARVVQMVEAGLELEVATLAKQYSWQFSAMHSIGYQEWKPFFERKATQQEVIAAIKQATRNFAKRQMTWFRGMERNNHTIRWIHEKLEAQRLIQSFL